MISTDSAVVQSSGKTDQPCRSSSSWFGGKGEKWVVTWFMDPTSERKHAFISLHRPVLGFDRLRKPLE